MKKVCWGPGAMTGSELVSEELESIGNRVAKSEQGL